MQINQTRGSRKSCCCIAHLAVFLTVGSLLTACGSRPRFEMDKQPKEVAPGQTISIGLTAVNPPRDTRYVWYSDKGKCDPPESASPWTKYTASTQTDRVTVEVKSGGKTLFSDGVDVEVNKPETTDAGALPQSAVEGSVTSGKAAIRISQVPAYDPVGGPTALEGIGGVVSGVDFTSFRVVVYAFTDNWYVQPFVMAPFTEIEPGGKWSTQSHLGSRYAALLVKPSFRPRSITLSLPGVGGDVVAVTTATGKR